MENVVRKVYDGALDEDLYPHRPRHVHGGNGLPLWIPVYDPGQHCLPGSRLLFWRSIYSHSDIINGLTFNETFLYVGLGSAIFILLKTYADWYLHYEIREGIIAIYLTSRSTCSSTCSSPTWARC
jgi:hypothetical protein